MPKGGGTPTCSLVSVVLASTASLFSAEGVHVPPGKGNGGGKPWPGWFCGNMGLLWACPSAAYDDVMESMTDCAFSWPISGDRWLACGAWTFARGSWASLTLVVVDYIAQMVAAGVVCLPHAHGVVRQVDVAVVA